MHGFIVHQNTPEGVAANEARAERITAAVLTQGARWARIQQARKEAGDDPYRLAEVARLTSAFARAAGWHDL